MMEKSYSVTIQEHKMCENDLKEKHLHTSILFILSKKTPTLIYDVQIILCNYGRGV